MRVWLLLLLLISSHAYGTAQIPDRITLDGKENALFSEPLSEYLFANGKEIPKLLSYIHESCTGSWRGYQARWEIRKTNLLLTSIVADPCNDEPGVVPLIIFFPEALGAPVHATWFSGKLIIPQGKRIRYVHRGYESRYEKYLVISVVRGVVLKTEKTGKPPAENVADKTQ
ncbi:hypothetical protein VVD49_17555 [Uliginosibacterium sp. H3]|uniref:Uncharacterized protein n=1 Tax=Uliginosibacterium silvisoli TaxID=3114758 RepID=A0ABU6K6M4_9RHOO|nr:hypothetical protein [Uliginosibacterium sp. H3]